MEAPPMLRAAGGGALLVSRTARRLCGSLTVGPGRLGVPQAPPPRPGTRKAEQPRAATIHEYLDWTVTSSAAEDEDELVRVYDT
jgi:hypothetical protein